MFNILNSSKKEKVVLFHKIRQRFAFKREYISTFSSFALKGSVRLQKREREKSHFLTSKSTTSSVAFGFFDNRQLNIASIASTFWSYKA